MTEKVTNPVRYELINKFGKVVGEFDSATSAADFAAGAWPDQEQDPERTGKGWDIQIAGAK